MKVAPAIGMLELSSLARGVLVVDAVVKRAPITLHAGEAVSNGKYILLFSGDVSSVEESLQAGVAVAGEYLVDQVFLPQIHPQVTSFLISPKRDFLIDSLGLIETISAATIIYVADAVCKTSTVNIVDLKLAKGIGGKGFLLFSGNLADVEASLDAGAELAQRFEKLTRKEVIPSPHQDLSSLLMEGGTIALR
ncbi:MAG TPA: BMC domain-containing protein [Bdellovibrionota bacterium]|nr:BMC domain-containing protein [Bdellovibrionota bacterium]